MNSPTNSLPTDGSMGNSPNSPGSPAAIANGCCCPIWDNANGNGMEWDLPFGGRCYWINSACPIHGVRDAYESTDATSDCCDLGKS
jgi:hypothetical protein